MTFDPTSIQIEVKELYLHNKRIIREDSNIEDFISRPLHDETNNINTFRTYIQTTKNANYNADNTLNNADRFVAYQNILRAVEVYIAENNIVSLHQDISTYYALSSVVSGTLEDYAFSSDLDAITAGATETTLSSYALASSLDLTDSNLATVTSDLAAVKLGADETTLSSYALESDLNALEDNLSNNYALDSRVNDLEENLSNNYATTAALSAVDATVDAITRRCDRNHLKQLRFRIRPYCS
jgi:hypothetical protein